MEELHSVRLYKESLVKEMVNSKGAISIVKEFGAKQDFIDAHFFSQHGPRFECVVKLESPVHKFPITRMGRGIGSNQKMAKGAAYTETLQMLISLPQFQTYMIQSRNNYSSEFSEALKKISEEQEYKRVNTSAQSLNIDQTFQDTLFDSLLQITKPIQVLDQFCNYYKFTISIRHSENSSLNVNEQFMCHIDLKLLDRTISHQATGSTKKNAKLATFEEFVGRLVRESGKFQKFAENIVKNKAEGLLIDQENVKTLHKKQNDSRASLTKNNQDIIMSAIERDEDNQNQESFLAHSDFVPLQMDAFVQKTPEIFKNRNHMAPGCPLAEDTDLKDINSYLLKGQERLGTIQKTFGQLQSYLGRLDAQVKCHLAGSYINTLFVEHSMVDIKLHSNLLYTPQLVLQFINQVPVDDIKAQVEYYQDMNVFQLNENIGNTAHYCYQLRTTQNMTYRLMFIYDSQLYSLSERVADEKQKMLLSSKTNMASCLVLFLLQVARCKKQATLEMITRQSPPKHYLTQQLLFEWTALLLFKQHASDYHSRSLSLPSDSSLSLCLHVLAKLPFYDSPHRLGTVLPQKEVVGECGVLARCFSRVAWGVYQEVCDAQEAQLLQMAQAYLNDNVFETGKQS